MFNSGFHGVYTISRIIFTQLQKVVMANEIINIGISKLRCVFASQTMSPISVDQHGLTLVELAFSTISMFIKKRKKLMNIVTDRHISVPFRS